MAKKAALRVTSTIARSWPAHGVSIKVGKSEHVDLPAAIVAQLENFRDAGLITIEDCEVNVKDADPDSYTKQDLIRERGVLQRLSGELDARSKKLEEDFAALAEEQAKLKAEREAFEKAKSSPPTIAQDDGQKPKAK